MACLASPLIVSIMPLSGTVSLGDDDARSRGRSELRGWATLTVDSAAQNGRTVEPTPRLENCYHASIHLNLDDRDDVTDLQDQHALELAVKAIWLPRPK